MRGKAEAIRADDRRQRWHTYHLIGAQVGFKSLPKIEQFIGSEGPPEPPRRKTAAELEAIGMRWHYALNAKGRKGG